MVWVERGSFLKSNLCDDGPDRLLETPLHEALVDSYLIGRQEVTFASLKRFFQSTGYPTPAEERESASGQSLEESPWRFLSCQQADDEPVSQISWNDAVL